MNYFIIFDNREKELIKIFQDKNYSCNLENLDIGDIQIVDLNTKEIIIIIERKTLADLSASIKDGRYKEQKERLIHSIKKNIRKIFLIEGDNYDNFSLPINTLNSVIINTLLRDNIHVHITKNILETVNFIENIMTHIPKYYSDLQKEIILGEDKSFQNEFNCQTSKKNNLTQNICFRNMLNQIPGISNSISTILVEKYSNMENFIKILRNNSSGNKEYIINTIGNEKYGVNNRKIGNKTAEKIYNYLFSDLESNSNNEQVSQNINVQDNINIQTNQVNLTKSTKNKNEKNISHKSDIINIQQIENINTDIAQKEEQQTENENIKTKSKNTKYKKTYNNNLNVPLFSC